MARNSDRIDLNSETDVLLIIDVQNDFCTGGALAVPDGEAVVPLINRLNGQFDHIVLTQDWHPAGHESFASSHAGKEPFETTHVSYGEQVLWPDHCVQGSTGAEFHADLETDCAQLVVRKGFRKSMDSYSAFFENDHMTPTGLSGYLRQRGAKRLFLAGLATDFCVLYSALDARHARFETYVIDDACRAIDLDGSLSEAHAAMEREGVHRITSDALLS